MASFGAGIAYGHNEASSPPTVHASLPMSAEDSSGSRSLALSPPNFPRTLSHSPGAASDLSNEAMAGHTGNTSMGLDFQTMTRPAHLHSNSTSTEAASRMMRGGFDSDNSNLPTPTPGQALDAADPEGQTFFPLQDRPNGSSSTSAISGSATAVNDPSSNGYATQSTSRSVGDFSQATAASSSGGVFEEVIPTTFDEATLRTLCDMDVSTKLVFC
jgi:hypothetical protein